GLESYIYRSLTLNINLFEYKFAIAKDHLMFKYIIKNNVCTYNKKTGFICNYGVKYIKQKY
ncbi:hypothetical protein, partial [Clostridium thailandense]|uniref:hypothetical protein n=1 Tax=Clostridium thailandense TaxID=2794346 RepID=UPI001C455B6B